QQRVVGELVSSESFDDLAEAPVDFENEVAVVSRAALALKFGAGHVGRVRGGKGDVEEEGFAVLVIVDPGGGVFGNLEEGGAVVVEEFGDRNSAGLDQGLPIPSQHALLQLAPPAVPAGEDAVPRRSADRRATVGVGKSHALAGEGVDVGALDF